MAEHNHVTNGGYLATRLQEAGIRKYFAVPGDYNLLLLDEMLKSPEMGKLRGHNEQ